jgi:hypothetical protein
MININNNQLVPPINPIAYTKEQAQPIINNYVDARPTYSPVTVSSIGPTKVYFAQPNINEANNNNAMNAINKQHSKSNNINPYKNNQIENQPKTIFNHENGFNPKNFASNKDADSFDNNARFFGNNQQPLLVGSSNYFNQPINEYATSKLPLITTVKTTTVKPDFYSSLKNNFVDNQPLVKFVDLNSFYGSQPVSLQDQNGNSEYVPSNKQTYSDIFQKLIDEVDNFTCVKDGLFADHSTNCRTFFYCQWTSTQHSRKVRFLCPGRTAFSQDQQLCDWIGNVKC